MHSSCRIPELHMSTGWTTKKNQLCQGLGELTSRDPSWKIRKKNQVCGRRLAQHLISLNQQCAESTSRINHDIRRVRSLLLSPSLSCLALSTLSALNQSERSLCSATGTKSTSCQSGAGSPRCSSVSSAYSTKSKRILKESTTNENVQTMEKSLNSYDDKNNTPEDKEERIRHNKPSSRLLLSLNTANDFFKCGHYSNQDLPVVVSSSHNQPTKTPQRWNFSARRCGYGESSTPRKCYHFPCKRPQTYSHIGFRGDYPQLKTFQWKRNITGAKTNRSESWDMPTGYPISRRCPINRQRDNKESLKHRLPSAVKLRPVDTAFREQLLKEEADRRRRVHQRSRPADWEVNYGQPTPFKRLWYPVRLKPNELVSW